jgi:hypothetical protein
MNDKRTLIALFSSVAMLTACGGGGGSEEPTTTTPSATDAVPPSASASAVGLKHYLTALSTMQVETKEPVDLSSFAPTTAEDDDPEPVE